MIVRNLLCMLIILAISYTTLARPWSQDSNSTVDVDIVPQSSPLTATIDSMTMGFSRTLKTLSPNMVPVFTVAALSYIGYVGSVMFFPSAMSQMGIPLLEDFSMETRLSRSAQSTQGFVDSIATGFMKDVLGKTEAADIVRNASTIVAKNSMDTLKITTKTLNSGIGSLQRMFKTAIIAVSPGCMSRHMCRVGQFTTVNLPVMGLFLRSIDSPGLDEYVQALIDGTTIGDCTSVFHDCPLDPD